MLGTDSQVALRARMGTKGALGYHLVDHFHEQIERAQQQHSRAGVRLRWTPGHVGMEGNERVDREAKKAARDGSSPQDRLPKSCRGCMPRSKSAAVQQQRGVSKSKVADILKRSPRYQ